MQLHEEVPPEKACNTVIEVELHQPTPPLNYQCRVYVRLDETENWYKVMSYFPDEVVLTERDLRHLSVRQMRDLCERLCNAFDRSPAARPVSSWEMS